MDNLEKILVIQLKRAGDVLLTTPIPTLLKRHWPAARVDFLVDQAFAPLLENNPSIDQVQVYNKNRPWRTLQRIRSECYDLILDFQSSPRSAIVALTSSARITAGYQVPFWGHAYRKTVHRPNSTQTVVRGKVSLVETFMGPVLDVPEPKIYLTADERTWSQSVGETKQRRIVGIVPTHRRNSRRWSLDSFAECARQLDQNDFAVWLFWGPGERDYVEKLQRSAPEAWLIPSTSLRQMAALFARCQCVITNDNGPMHIAAAMGVPTVTLYGPTDPKAWNPGGPKHLILQASGVSCLGCNLNECPFEHECMTQLSPPQVMAACETLLRRTPEEVSV